MISTRTANLNSSLSIIGYTEVESCLIDLDFDDGDDVNLTHGICGKGKSRVGHNDYVPYRKQRSSENIHCVKWEGHHTLSLGANCSITGKGKSSNSVLFTDDKLPNFTFASSQILTPNVVGMPSSFDL